MARVVLFSCIVCALAAPVSAQPDIVNGNLFTLTNTPTAPNGGWNWVTDERVIIDDSDPSNTLLLLSSVSDGSGAEEGDVDLLWRNLDTGVQGEFELHNQLEDDDHNEAALYQRTDGRYVALYTGHFLTNDTFWRVSTNPHDPTSWGPEQTLNNGALATYNAIYYLPDDNNGAGRLYNFTRTTGWDPNVQVSNDQGSTWIDAGKLLTEGTSGDRPYLEYASHGDEIHFISTQEHPRQVQNSIYHGYVKDGVLYDTYGEVVDPDIFDDNAVSPTVLPKVFENGTEFNGTPMYRGWTYSLELDNTDNPVGIISVRANDNDLDHRWLYARFDGVEWQVNEMAHGGSYLYPAENDYLGAVAIDPQNPNVVYMSNDIDPRDGTPTTNHEIYKGVTSDFGETWTWTAITENSTMDNLRPAVPEWDGQNTAVAWLRGTYTTYTDYSAEVVGINFAVTDNKALLWRGDAGSPDAWDINNTTNWDSGGGVTDVYNDGDEVAFDDTAASFNVELQGAVTPIGVAFNNSANAYTVTGAGIGGNGGLRVIGGGAATLANGANTYTGDTMIARGTLALSGAATLDNTPHINVKSNGTFDVTATTTGSYALDNQTLTIDGDVVGDIVATNGSTVEVNSNNSMDGDVTVQSGSLVTGAGKVTGNLVAENGTVRVGGDGLTVGASQFVIDDFESYGLGNLNAVANPPWTGHASTTLADIEDDGSGNKVLTFGGTSGTETYGAVSRPMPDDGQIDNTEIATFFFRLNSKTDDPDSSFGLAEQANTSNNFVFSDFKTQVRVIDDPGATGTYLLDARDGNDFTAALATGLMPDSWYNVWMVVDQTTDTYDVYMNTGTGDATGGNQIANDLDFRSGSTDVLDSILGAWGPAPITNGVRYDTLAFLDGFDLTNPLGGLDPVLLGNGETLTVEGDATMNPAATLELDIATPTIVDLLAVTGNLSAGGALDITLAPQAPAPQLGDMFDILDFASASGAFDTFNLPSLSPGLFWKTSNLLTTGVLEVVSTVPGDADGDGDVDLDDYNIMSGNMYTNVAGGASDGDFDNDGDVDFEDFVIQALNFGDWPSAEETVGNLVPEPGSAMLLGLSMILLTRAGRSARSDVV